MTSKKEYPETPPVSPLSDENPAPVEAAPKPTKAAKLDELKPKQVWAEGSKENPFERSVEVLISDLKDNDKKVRWVKFSRYTPNVGNTPFEYLTEKEFRATYPAYVSPEL